MTSTLLINSFSPVVLNFKYITPFRYQGESKQLRSKIEAKFRTFSPSGKIRGSRPTRRNVRITFSNRT